MDASLVDHRDINGTELGHIPKGTDSSSGVVVQHLVMLRTMMSDDLLLQHLA